jgi:hypothetical protein
MRWLWATALWLFTQGDNISFLCFMGFRGDSRHKSYAHCHGEGIVRCHSSEAWVSVASCFRDDNQLCLRSHVFRWFPDRVATWGTLAPCSWAALTQSWLASVAEGNAHRLSPSQHSGVCADQHCLPSVSRGYWQVFRQQLAVEGLQHFPGGKVTSLQWLLLGLLQISTLTPAWSIIHFARFLLLGSLL